MMEFKINSRKYGTHLTFTHFAEGEKGSAIWVNSNGREGTLGKQCTKPNGSAYRVNEKNARRIAYRWIKENYGENE